MGLDKAQFDRWAGRKGYITQNGLQKIFENSFDFIIELKTDEFKKSGYTYRIGKDRFMSGYEMVYATWLTGINFVPYVPATRPEGYTACKLSGEDCNGRMSDIVANIFNRHGKNGRLCWNDYKKIETFWRGDVPKQQLRKDALRLKQDALAGRINGFEKYDPVKIK
jgi:hypothetical protein